MFMIFGFLDVSRPPPTKKRHYLSLETPGHIKQIKNKYGNILKHTIFEIMRITNFENIRKSAFSAEIVSILFYIIFSEDEDRGNDKLGKHLQQLGWI